MAPVLNEPSSVSNILQGDSSCSPLPYFLYPRPTIIRVTPSSTIASSFQSSFMPPGGEDLITRGEWIPLLPSLASPIHSPFHRSRHSFYPFPPPPPQLFQKLPSHGRPLVRFSALSSLTRSSRHRDHERTRSLDEEKEDLIVNISSLIFEISSLYPESL